MANVKKVRLFSSDLDGTLLGNPGAVVDFRKTWEMNAEDSPILVYNTGRLHDDARRAIREGGLPEPDFFITGVGTVVYDVVKGETMEGFSDLLDEDWDLSVVREKVMSLAGIEEQPPEHQHSWKSSWFWYGKSPEEVGQLRNDLLAADIQAQVVYSSSRDLDVLPLRANKGNAITWLCGHLGVGLDEVVVAGDTGNDSSMFLVPGVRGIVPENVEPELLQVIEESNAYQAKGSCAEGILRGLIHYGVFPEVAGGSCEGR
ncbi:MAG: HAD family hydrolase [Luteolibacter sp.]